MKQKSLRIRQRYWFYIKRHNFWSEQILVAFLSNLIFVEETCVLVVTLMCWMRCWKLTKF